MGDCRFGAWPNMGFAAGAPDMQELSCLVTQRCGLCCILVVPVQARLNPEALTSPPQLQAETVDDNKQ